MPLILLQHLGEWSTSSALWLAGIQALGTDLILGVAGSVGVQAEQDLLIVQRVLLLDASTLGASGSLGGADHGLDFRRVDQTADISLRDDVGGKEEVFLEFRRGRGRTVDSV